MILASAYAQIGRLKSMAAAADHCTAHKQIIARFIAKQEKMEASSTRKYPIGKSVAFKPTQTCPATGFTTIRTRPKRGI